jgi:RHS repeat-associated protein
MGGKLLAEYRPADNRNYYYTTDQIGSTRIVADQNGVVVYAVAHDPYGGIQQTWESGYDPALKFSGKERDTESGLDYFGGRYYDHTLYRFLSVDPVVLAGALDQKRWNLYAYCGGNPSNYVDPDGSSYLVFCIWQQLLYVYTEKGLLVGVFPASNHVERGYEPFPSGEYPFSDYRMTPGNEDSDSMDRYGIAMFSVPGRSGLGVHAGRIGVFDGYGRSGWQHCTHGCIRTTPEAMLWIWFLHDILRDRLKKITVTEEYVVVDANNPTGSEEMNRIKDEFDRYVSSFISFYLFLADPFFIYGPIPPWAN